MHSPYPRTLGGGYGEVKAPSGLCRIKFKCRIKFAGPPCSLRRGARTDGDSDRKWK